MSRQDTEIEQASSRSDLSLNATCIGHQVRFCGSHEAGGGIVDPVSVVLLRHVPTLSCEESEVILFLNTDLDEIHILGLVDDRAFLGIILPSFSWDVLRYFVECLRSGRS